MKVFRYLLVFACILLFSSCVGMNSPQKIDWNELDYYKELTLKEVQADIAQVIEKTEATHPYMTMKDTPQSITDNYKVAKEKLQAINTGMTTFELYVHIAEYLASFSDTHTGSGLSRTKNSLVIVLPFEYRIDASIKKLVIMDYPSVDANVNRGVGTVITEIGGISVDVLIDMFSKMTGKENSAGISNIIGFFYDGDVLKLAGCKIENNQIEFKFETGESKLLEVLTLAEYRIKYLADDMELTTPVKTHYKDTFNTTSDASVKTHSYKKNEDGSLYLRMLAMNNYDGSFDELLSVLEAEVDNGVTNVVIDIRENGGGNAVYPARLLHALGFSESTTEGPYIFSKSAYAIGLVYSLSPKGGYYRYSMASRNYYNSVKAKGDVYFKPFVRNENKNENDINLKILINAFSASASMAFIAQVRYSGYGEIIGQASAQSPNFCANTVRFQLDNSGIIYYIPVSYSYYMDGDKKADNIIIPDIVVPVTEDALDYVEWD